MDIAVKITNASLNTFEASQKALTTSFKALVDEKNFLASSIQDIQLRKNKLEEILKSLDKEKEKLNFDNKTLTEEMEITKQAITEKKREAESKITRELETFTLEKETEQKRLAQLLNTLETKEDKFYVLEDKLNKLSKKLSDQENNLSNRETSVSKEKENIVEKETVLDKKIKEADIIKASLDTREEGILPLEKKLAEKEKDLRVKLNNFQEVFTNKTTQMEKLTKELEDRDTQYKIKFKSLHQMAEVLKKKEIRLHDRETIFKLNSP